eukprot:m.153421 g.153421  ORF g.153421 m.153421 type:complete len:348 (+) comp14289_c0_seq1:230-1273(+)
MQRMQKVDDRVLLEVILNALPGKPDLAISCQRLMTYLKQENLYPADGTKKQINRLLYRHKDMIGRRETTPPTFYALPARQSSLLSSHGAGKFLNDSFDKASVRSHASSRTHDSGVSVSSTLPAQSDETLPPWPSIDPVRPHSASKFSRASALEQRSGLSSSQLVEHKHKQLFPQAQDHSTCFLNPPQLFDFDLVDAVKAGSTFFVYALNSYACHLVQPAAGKVRPELKLIVGVDNQGVVQGLMIHREHIVEIGYQVKQAVIDCLSTYLPNVPASAVDVVTIVVQSDASKQLGVHVDIYLLEIVVSLEIPTSPICVHSLYLARHLKSDVQGGNHKYTNCLLPSYYLHG